MAQPLTSNALMRPTAESSSVPLPVVTSAPAPVAASVPVPIAPVQVKDLPAKEATEPCLCATDLNAYFGDLRLGSRGECHAR